MKLVAAAVVLAAAGAAGVAHADPARVDWARGLVIADGFGVADRHAPNPSVALGTARRGAEDRAKAALADAVTALPMAGGGTVGARAAAAVAAAAYAVDAQPETDGSWHVQMAVPIEAVRQAVVGARAVDAAGDRAPAVVVVAGVAAKPAVGWTVGGVVVPTLFVAELPAWAATAPRVTATGAAGGKIDAKLPAGATGATLVIVVGVK
nr:hypothetical protein [Kofleriaceae bacterium]